jgi:hypothetical protein
MESPLGNTQMSHYYTPIAILNYTSTQVSQLRFETDSPVQSNKKFQKEEVEEEVEEKLLITRDTRDGRAVDCGQK